MDAFAALADALNAAGVRYVVTGVWGANYYAGSTLFVTKDQDLFLPPDAANLRLAWQVCAAAKLDLRCDREPLEQPRDLVLAQAVVQRAALTSATDGGLLWVDLSLVMAGLTFDEVWQRHRTFRSAAVEVPVASLADILAAKATADRPKDRLFLATHEAELRRLLGDAP